MSDLTYDKNGNVIGTAPDLSATEPTTTSSDLIQSKIRNSATHYGVDPNLALAIARQESSFNPNAKSSAGAVGVMQLMPETASSYGIRPEERTNPDKNIDAGMRYLADLQKKHGGDKAKMLIEYNSGPKNVDKDFNDLPEETQGYLTNILGPNAKSQSGPTIYDKNGNILNGGVNLNQAQANLKQPTSTVPQPFGQYGQVNPQTNQQSTEALNWLMGKMPPVVGGAVGELFGGPAGSSFGTGLGSLVSKPMMEGRGITDEDIADALKETGLSFGIAGAGEIPGELKYQLTSGALRQFLNKTGITKQPAVQRAINLIEEQRRQLTGGIPSGKTEGEQNPLKAKLGPAKAEESADWGKVYDRMDKANKTIDTVNGQINTGVVDSSTGKPITRPNIVPVNMQGPIQISRNSQNYIDNQIANYQAQVNAHVINKKDFQTYQMLVAAKKAMVVDKDGNAFIPFRVIKPLRSDIGKSAAEEEAQNLQARGKSIGVQRGTAVQTGLRNTLGDDIDSSLYDIGGSDALNEYARASGMTQNRVKASVFDKVMTRNTNYNTGNLNVDKAINDFSNPTSRDALTFTDSERKSIVRTLQTLKNVSPSYDGALKFGSNGWTFYSVLRHPQYAIAIPAKAIYEKLMADPKYARVLTQLPSAPSKSSQAGIMTRSIFGALKGTAVTMIAPSGMRVSAHIDQNGEPKPDFQLNQ